MSEDNAEIIRSLYAAFERGDLVAALDRFHPDVELDATHRVDGRVGHGVGELAAIVAEWMEPWEDFRQQVDEVRDLGDRVFVLSTQRGRGRASGIESEGRFVMIYELEGGRITRWVVYDDLDAGRAAAGLAN